MFKVPQKALKAPQFLPERGRGFTFMMNFNLFMSLLSHALVQRAPGVGRDHQRI